MPHTFLLATDHKQSVIAEQADDEPNAITYAAYGHPSALQPLATQLAFNGAFRERPSGWYFLGKGCRIYNPILMCFHSPDSWSPFGEGGFNAYRYCDGDPVNYSDPSGHMRRLFGGSKKKERYDRPPRELTITTPRAVPNQYEVPENTPSAATASSAAVASTSSAGFTQETPPPIHHIMRPSKHFDRRTHITLGEIEAAREATEQAAKTAALAKKYQAEVEQFQDSYGEWRFRPKASASQSPRSIRDPKPES